MTSLFQWNEAFCESMCSSTRWCGLTLSCRDPAGPWGCWQISNKKLSLFGYLRLAGMLNEHFFTCNDPVYSSLRLCKAKQIPKIRVAYESGWVGPGHSEFCFFGKSSQNSSKQVLIPCVFWYECSVNVRDGFKKRSLDGGGWALSSFILDCLNFLTLQSPLVMYTQNHPY